MIFVKKVVLGFPSPLGASYFQMCEVKGDHKLFKVWFPSPLGASYFQMRFDELFDRKCEVKVFPSPLGASYFQIQWGLMFNS